MVVTVVVQLSPIKIDFTSAAAVHAALAIINLKTSLILKHVMRIPKGHCCTKFVLNIEIER